MSAVADAIRVAHPLEPLTAEEVGRASDILRAERNLHPEHVRFVSVSLHEPPKETVLAFNPGAQDNKFQQQPVGAVCNPFSAQSAHTGGINVAMGDGSVRSVALDISAATWSAVLTPFPLPPSTISDTVGSDWN